MASEKKFVLVGDCGGTNTRLQLYELAPCDAKLEAGQRAPGTLVFEEQYLNGDYTSFVGVVREFLKRSGTTESPATACFGVAGPVEQNAVSFTNRDWKIDGANIEAEFGIAKVRLINDFVASGYGLLTLDVATECVTLQEAPKVRGAPIACIGAGTGLGECFSTATEEMAPYETYPSEGGHAEWCPRTDLELELLSFLKAKFKGEGSSNRVSVERLVSGPGLASIYEFYAQRFPKKREPSVHELILEAGEMKGRVIAEHAFLPSARPFCTLCEMTMHTFATAFGSEAGVAALKWIPLGGLYISGGLAPKNQHLLKGASSPFMKAFHDKGRVSPLLKRVPIYLVLEENVGQRGAHLVAVKLMGALSQERLSETGAIREPQQRTLSMRRSFSQKVRQSFGRGAKKMGFNGGASPAKAAGSVGAGSPLKPGANGSPAPQRRASRFGLRSLRDGGSNKLSRPVGPPATVDAYLLAGDCGGTNTRLQIFRVAVGDVQRLSHCAPGELVFEKQYLNGEHRSFCAIVQSFLDESGTDMAPSAACFGVAGPVEDNAVSFTNRDWKIDGAAVEAEFGIAKVRLINDFVASGYGLLTLDTSTECATLQGAPKVAGAPIACIGAGTGLGECFSTATAEGEAYETYASEGGHAEWAPRDAIEVELLSFLKNKFKAEGSSNRVSVERLVSGPGLASIYEFYAQRFPEQREATVHEKIASAGEMKGREIAEHSQRSAAPFCSLCEMTMNTFATAFGSEAGVAALKWIPLGGLYISGGLAPKNAHLLKGANSPFMKAFHDKGRVSPLLKRVPIYLVLEEDIGQRGAHLFAFRMLQGMDDHVPAPLVKFPAAMQPLEMASVRAELPEEGADEYSIVKQGTFIKGKYSRLLSIGKTGIATLEPEGRKVTNFWPLNDVIDVSPQDVETATGEAGGEAGGEEPAKFTLRLSARPMALLCMPGSEQHLTFAASNKAQREEVIDSIMARIQECKV